MLRSERDALVRVLLSQLVRDKLKLILLLRFPLNPPSLTRQRIILVRGTGQLLPQRVYIHSQLLVLSFGLIQP